jgi:hypothetical protein
METVCKTVARKRYTGSNPVLPTISLVGIKNRWLAPSFLVQRSKDAHVAQSVEHILGKNEVNSSILFMGFGNSIGA